MALVGPGTAFETIQDIQVPTLFEAKLQECRAGAAILFIEAVNSGVHWGEPGDFDVETVTKEQLFPGDTEGILVAFADWSIWYIERTVPMETLKHFMTIESSKEHDREKELSPYGKWIPRDSWFLDSRYFERIEVMEFMQQIPITPLSTKQTAAMYHIRRVAAARQAWLNNATVFGYLPDPISIGKQKWTVEE